MRKLNLNIPETWKGLRKKELKYIGFLYNQQIDESEFLAYAFIYLSGLKIMSRRMHYSYLTGENLQWFKVKGEKPFLLSTVQIAEHAEAVRYLLKIDEVNPIRWLRGRRVCHPRLFGVPLRQYLTMENFFQAYAHTKEERYLDQLIASAYHFPWQKFSDEKVQKRAKAFKGLSLATKMTVFLFYGGVRVYLKKEYPKLFTESTGSEPPDMKRQFRTILRSLNKGNIAENDRILNADVHDALAELDALMQEQEEQKRRNKKK
ncbi:MAG: hypothetical protein K9J27_11565 [Bacteroidales bacterium]|nr:hypothetical protein [Bacteroidales bacterium]